MPGRNASGWERGDAGSKDVPVCLGQPGPWSNGGAKGRWWPAMTISYQDVPSLQGSRLNMQAMELTPHHQGIAISNRNRWIYQDLGHLTSCQQPVWNTCSLKIFANEAEFWRQEQNINHMGSTQNRNISEEKTCIFTMQLCIYKLHKQPNKYCRHIHAYM